MPLTPPTPQGFFWHYSEPVLVCSSNYILPIFGPKLLKINSLWGSTYPYSSYKEVPLTPPPTPQAFFWHYSEPVLVCSSNYILPIFGPKLLKINSLWGSTYPYSSYKEVPLPPPPTPRHSSGTIQNQYWLVLETMF